jgi:hypothetical protein
MKSIKHRSEEGSDQILPEDLKTTKALLEKNAITKDSDMTVKELALSIKLDRVHEAMSELELVADGVKEEYRETQEDIEKTYRPEFFKLSIPELDILLRRIRDHGCMGCDYNCLTQCIYDPDAQNGFGELRTNKTWYPAVCPLYPDVESILQGLIHRLKIYNIDSDFWERTEGHKSTLTEVFRDISGILRKTERRLSLIGKGPDAAEGSVPSGKGRDFMGRMHKAFDTLEGSFDLVRGHPCCSVCAEDELVHRNRVSGKRLHAHWTMDSLDFAERDHPKVGIRFGETSSGRKSQAATALIEALRSEALDVDDSDMRWGLIRVSLDRKSRGHVRVVK